MTVTAVCPDCPHRLSGHSLRGCYCGSCKCRRSVPPPQRKPLDWRELARQARRAREAQG